ncbi:hypothetical protein AYI68_g7927 [Smittium mucronatum]|uniref:Uncharacterized protein n=1 Tax=Smittium mucronatum TaxID=133383 RepID=A0A1R0GMC8_9FUNG|nr:hypothetical protein AYI68_g7927 [Smittium mucronatum]
MKMVEEKYKLICPCCGLKTPETTDHILIECYRWNSIRNRTTGRCMPSSIKNSREVSFISSNEVHLELVGKILGGGSKIFFSQLRAGAAGQNIELETAKFSDGIRVARLTILEGISESPAPLNQFPVGTEPLERQMGVG